MNCRHVIQLVESKRLSSLSDVELKQLQDHLAGCDDCRRAYTAAQLASAMLHSRAAEVIEPSPFFAKRVMALIRAQSAPSRFDLMAMWNTARGFVYSAVVLVLVLTVLTLVAAGPEAGPLAVARIPDTYT